MSEVPRTRLQEDPSHARPFGGVSQKSIFKRSCQPLVMNAHKMAPITTRWLQERRRDSPTKGLQWRRGHTPARLAREHSRTLSAGGAGRAPARQPPAVSTPLNLPSSCLQVASKCPRPPGTLSRRGELDKPDFGDTTPCSETGVTLGIQLRVG